MSLVTPKKGYKSVPWLFGKEIEIPEDWEVKELEKFSNIIMGMSPPSESYNKNQEGLPFYQGVTDFGENYPNTTIWCSDPKKIAEKDQILFSVRAPVGETNITKEQSCLGRGVCSINPLENELMYCYFLISYFKKQFVVYAQGTTYDAINRNEIVGTRLPFTSNKKEQQKIASILSNVDSLIDSTSKIIENSKSLKTGLMQKLLTKGIGHSKFKKVRLFPRYNEETIPEDWNVDRLDNLIRIMDYRGRTPLFSESGITHLRSNNIRDGQINFKDITFVSEKTYEEYMTRGIPQEDDVLFTTEGPLGEVALVPKNFKFSLAQRIIVLRPKSKIIPKFLKYLLLDRKVRTRYEGLATGTTLGGIASKWFTKLFLPYPKDISEQQQIASILINIDAQIDSQTQYKDKLERLKKSLMQKLLTGEVRVAI